MLVVLAGGDTSSSGFSCWFLMMKAGVGVIVVTRCFG